MGAKIVTVGRIKMLNLTKDNFYLSELENGKTRDVVVRVGRVVYMLDFDKCGNTILIDKYRRLNKKRQKYSKYGEDGYNFIMCDGLNHINRSFIENFDEIAKTINEAEKLERYYGIKHI